MSLDSIWNNENRYHQRKEYNQKAQDQTLCNSDIQKTERREGITGVIDTMTSVTSTKTRKVLLAEWEN